MFIVGRGILTPLFYEDSPIMPNPPFSNPPPPLPCRLQASSPRFVLLSCFFGDPTTFDVLFYLMISWMYTCRTPGS